MMVVDPLEVREGLRALGESPQFRRGAQVIQEGLDLLTRLECQQGVIERDRCVCIGRRIDDQGVSLRAGFLYPVNQFAFMIALPEDETVARAFKQGQAARFDIRKRVMTINFRLTDPKEVEVWAIEDIYGLGHETFEKARSGPCNVSRIGSQAERR